ncbi:hypothetical protein CLV25_11187 [Acetobacteroides hydrogenigenes]|uniref:Uncharacterized protein n=1 Tax=Acetobacteroides hydrogenigenes TaxID=979970 RepID=A0A4R2EC01_9BACT|nr:hypothetical protein CLV25_11187 [Acetobacteroides hydrogenigenes]
MVRNHHFVGEICFAPTIPTITTIHKFVQCNVHDWALLRIRVKQHLDNGAEYPYGLDEKFFAPTANPM